MKNLRQVFLGIIIALASIGLLLGGFSLSLAEGNTIKATSTATPTATLTLMPTSSPTWQPTSLSVSITPVLDSATPSSTWTPTVTITPPPSPANCPPPVGWLVYFVQPGETLDAIAARYRISSAELQGANCLLTPALIPGVVLYVPPMRTQTPLPCGAPYGWIAYYVQPGDTLYRLSLAYGISVADLQRANCQGASTLLHTGQLIFVPPWLPHPATPTHPVLILPTSTPFPGQPSNTPAATLTTAPPTSLPTDTSIPVPSDTPVELPTATPIPTT
jgi:LysM repeat protein